MSVFRSQPLSFWPQKLHQKSPKQQRYIPTTNVAASDLVLDPDCCAAWTTAWLWWMYVRIVCNTPYIHVHYSSPSFFSCSQYLCTFLSPQWLPGWRPLIVHLETSSRGPMSTSGISGISKAMSSCARLFLMHHRAYIQGIDRSIHWTRRKTKLSRSTSLWDLRSISKSIC